MTTDVLALLEAGAAAELISTATRIPLPEAQALKAAYDAGRASKRRTKRRFAVSILAGALTLLTARVALSQVTCAQTLPFGLVTMCADAPALASEVNGNFALLANWLNEKVGARTSTTITTSSIESSGTLTINTTSSAPVRFGSSVTVGGTTASCTSSNVGALRARQAALEFCNGGAWLPLGGGGTQAMSCAALRAANPALPNGHYVLKAAGYQFSADCDMAGGGWTLIQAHATNVRTVESLAVSSGNGTALPAAVVRALAQASTQLRVESGGASAVSSANGPAITALRNLNAGQEPGSSWVASNGFNTSVFNYSCAATSRYPDTYHACGNGAGLHIVGDIHHISSSGGTSDINLWVK